MKIDHKTASKLVGAYNTIQSTDAALSRLAVVNIDKATTSFAVATAAQGSGYNNLTIVNDATFSEPALREIVAFLIMAERRRLSAIRAGAIRTINQIGGVTPPPHPFAL